ncbi:MAG: hypothetical protein LBV06_08730 [Propionibacteriaceae bacterium]|jgi:hypothetical protein|nr:hypothetical protein [Propionibacteriaceae bacterium]
MKARRVQGVGVGRGDSPRLSVIWTEAWRNVTSGVTRALLLALAFGLAIGGAGVAQARVVVDFIHEATVFRDSGAAIQVITSKDQIHGGQCDGLASLPGILASGALRGGPDVRVAALPSTKATSLEVTPGFVEMLASRNVAKNQASSGVWVAANLAERAGVDPNRTAMALVDGSELSMVGTYDSPNDGRASTLDYVIVSPVASDALFDACWVFAWPRPEAALDVAMIVVAPQATGPGVKPASPIITQLNTTHGLSFDGPVKFARLPLWPITIAAVAVGAILGFTAIRLRRLELAGALHAGVAKSALTLQLMIETAVWLGVALIPAAVVALEAAMAGNTDWWPAWWPAVRTLALAGVAALIGTGVGLALTRQNQLFRYFKRR